MPLQTRQNISMAINKLTDLKIKAQIRQVQDQISSFDAATKPKNKLIGDGQGLYLAISKQATANWLFRYMVDGKAKAVGLGAYPATSLHKARAKAQALRDSRADGVDPAQANRENNHRHRLLQKSGKTFKECATEFIEYSRPSWRNAKHAQQWTNTLTKYVYPVIGENTIGTIHQDQILKILAPIWREKRETATRVRARIEAILHWTSVHGWRTGENPARFKDHMEFLLPKGPRAKKEHHPSLPYEQLPAFMNKLHKQEGMARYALEFLILCASRTGEIIGAEWKEFDLTKRLWVIPASRMKAGVEHRVPLTERAITILEKIRPFSGQKYVFVSGKEDKPPSTMGMAMLLRRMQEMGITVHGMRSTFRNWAGERTDYPFEVCEQAIAHRLPDAVAIAYLRTDFFEKRVGLMKDWARFALSECER